MIKVPLNKDVGSYEAKFVGPFTLRQSLCVLAAAPVCWGIYSGLTPILGGDIAGFLVLFPAALCWLIGWYKPSGTVRQKCWPFWLRQAARRTSIRKSPSTAFPRRQSVRRLYE